ncbi:sensor histidine kinase [Labedella endophytica]|uniref:Sensor-like histidine kinase SenX3 n=1 Tax=Labedella endophytica TaxID=1523160 RepID=A0A433JS37_9MICO|nr:ATP-binding protein [Labedella endophytica]RUR01000.1 sensor histidine kinase [Labedella endophytica]
MRTAEEITRRSAIAEYHLVGEPPRADLQSLVQLAATLCGVSKAVINIIDDRFQHQVAAIGMEPASCTREDSMCARVFERPGHVTVRDARVDERFADNPFVTGEIADVRFYASSPLVTPAGIAIGTLCVFDEDPKDLNPETSDALKILAHQVVDVLELRRITAELGTSNEQLAQFAGQVSHDLRNPLMAVSGFLELASDSPEMVNAPEAAKSLARAESAADRMARMITDLLHFARVGGAQPRMVDIDLEELVRTVLEDLDSSIRETGAGIVVDARLDVVGDRTLLGAVIQNLVANALKFSSAEGKTPQIGITAMEISSGWRISVDDDGPGVPISERERVFALMERAVGDEIAGLGIGLSTCRRIVQAHGGSMGIEDSALGGASVWLVLPRGTNPATAR